MQVTQTEYAPRCESHLIAFVPEDRTMITAGQFKRGTRNPFLVGVPFVSFTVLGWLGIGYMNQGRKQVKDTRDDVEWAAIQATRSLSREGPVGDPQPRKKLDLQQELEVLKSKVNLDVDSFDYKPVPRPRSG